MNQKGFILRLLEDGCILLRVSSRHDIYLNPTTGQKQPVPKHKEIDNSLAKHIRKYLGLD